jgi:hypothetical protein
MSHPRNDRAAESQPAAAASGRPGQPRPGTPRPPARPAQPPRPSRHEPGRTRSTAGRPSEYVIVWWIAPELRERNPGMPLSLHEALQVGQPAGRYVPIPIPPMPDPQRWWTYEPSWESQAEREAQA